MKEIEASSMHDLRRRITELEADVVAIHERCVTVKKILPIMWISLLALYLGLLIWVFFLHHTILE